MYDAMYLAEPDAKPDMDNAALLGLANLFAYTDHGESIILSFDAKTLLPAVNQILDLFFSVKSAENSVAPQTIGREGHPIRSLYNSLLKNHGILPSDLDRQDPVLLYLILTEDYASGVSVDEIPASLRDFYGF